MLQFLTRPSANLLALSHVHLRRLDLSQCSLGDAGLSQLWTSLAGQAKSLEWIDTSNNHGVVRFETIQTTLSKMRKLSKLNIAGNTRILSDESLFNETTIYDWELQELDLSGMMVGKSIPPSPCRPFSCSFFCSPSMSWSSNLGLMTMRFVVVLT